MTLADRFWEHVDKSGECWLWTGASRVAGYGHLKIAGRTHGAHRVAYEMQVGPIPPDMVIDHLCRTTKCVRPTHLEAVTPSENVRRGITTRTRTRRGQGDWRTVLRKQGRTLRWLALQTGKSPRTVYAYSRGDLIPPAEWIAAVARLLGVELAA